MFFMARTVAARSSDGSTLAMISGSKSNSFSPRRSIASFCNKTTTSLGKNERIWSSHFATRGNVRPLTAPWGRPSVGDSHSLRSISSPA